MNGKESKTGMNQSFFQIRVSESVRDDEWDAFVESEAQGSFEQTSGWAEAKWSAGWKSIRVVVLLEDRILGGSQILVKQLPFGFRVGYLPRGPVCDNGRDDVLTLILAALKKVCKDSHLSCLIVQPANNGSLTEDSLIRSGFRRDATLGIISATTAIDLIQTYEAILSRMTRNFRYNIRFAERNGVIIRDGKREEIGLFFRLMLETCRRQGVSPNPSTESFIQKLWDVFSPHGNIRFFLAEYNGEVVSGLMCIPFGKVCNAWKMGWSGKHENSRAVHFLHWKAIQWAKDNGYHSYDFMGINRALAETILEGNHFYKVAKGANLFKLSFGGEVRLLPEAYYYFKSPLLGLLYTKVYPYFRKIKGAIV